MKKALVLITMLVVGFAFAASADGLSGEFTSSITIDPSNTLCNPCGLPGGGFLTLGGGLTIEYGLSGWTFASVSTFDNGGFASQVFSVAGTLGAFTLASSMTFDPMAVTVWDYHVQTPSTGWCGLCPTAVTWAPRFLKWDVTAGVSIAGVLVEAYVLQDYANYNVENRNFAVIPATGVQTSSYTCASYNNGMGWRLKIAGSFGDVTVTSLTYFNLSESNKRETYCPAIGKRAVFSIVNPTCDFVFTEEYLMLQGFSFACATVDIGLSILCTGFNYVEFLVSDVSIGGWLALDFELKFTTSEKSLAWCLDFTADQLDCFTLEIGFGTGKYLKNATIISDIQIHGFGLVYSWNGISFTSYTELDIYSDLISPETSTGVESWSYFYGCNANQYWIPYGGGNCGAIVCDDLPPDCIGTVYTCVDTTAGYETIICIPTERYRLWEMFQIDIDADACCGGLFDLTIATYFGEHESLSWAGYAVYNGGVGTPSVGTLYGTVPAATFSAIASSTTGCDYVTYDYDYADSAQTTLFDWAKTDVDLGVGIGSNVTLTFGFSISAFGWESVSIGFDWEF